MKKLPLNHLVSIINLLNSNNVEFSLKSNDMTNFVAIKQNVTQIIAEYINSVKDSDTQYNLVLEPIQEESDNND